MDNYIKQRVDSGNIKELRYIFAGALDADPTFERYEEEYRYCQECGILDVHAEMRPFMDRSQWNEQYFVSLKQDLMENFSAKRMDHMRKVALVVFAEKVKRLREERLREKQLKEQRQAARTVTPVASPANSGNVVGTGNVPSFGEQGSQMTASERQKKEMEEAARQLAERNRRTAELEKAQEDKIAEARKAEARKAMEAQRIVAGNAGAGRIGGGGVNSSTTHGDRRDDKEKKTADLDFARMLEEHPLLAVAAAAVALGIVVILAVK